MAGAGYKDFTTGEVLTAANVDNYLMEQTVMVFASAAARTTALSAVLAEGMISYLKDTNSTEYYSGSAWVAIAGASGSMTQLATGSFSNNTMSLTSISGSYKNLYLVLNNIYGNNVDAQFRFNADSGSNYAWAQMNMDATSINRTNSSAAFQVSYPYLQNTYGPNFFALTIYDYANTNSWKAATCSYAGQAVSATKNGALSIGTYASTSAITGISTNQAFVSGTYTLYGVN